jgi:hypothetical protein
MKLLSIVIAVASIMGIAEAAPRDVAYKMYSRLTGTPPKKEILDQMTTLISEGKSKEAAAIAMAEENFYSVFVRNMVSPWVNKDGKRDYVLNDYTATLIGMIRDDVDFSTVMTHDFVYVSKTLNTTIPYSRVADLTEAPAPAGIVEGNQHYIEMERRALSFKDKEEFIQIKQPTDIPPSGIITTREFGQQYFVAGTNRAPLVALTKNFLCRDIETLADNTRSDMYVRQDVPRSPSGDSLTFLSKCSGCHAGMDPLTRAFAFIDWDEGSLKRGLIYEAPAAGATPEQIENKVRSKMVRNSHVYPNGAKSKDDKWINLWHAGQNENVGFRGAETGNGYQSLGKALSESESFDTCMPQKVYQSVCLVKASTENDKLFIKKVSSEWKTGGYKMKDLIAAVASQCLVRSLEEGT